MRPNDDVLDSSMYPLHVPTTTTYLGPASLNVPEGQQAARLARLVSSFFHFRPLAACYQHISTVAPLPIYSSLTSWKDQTLPGEV